MCVITVCFLTGCQKKGNKIEQRNFLGLLSPPLPSPLPSPLTSFALFFSFLDLVYSNRLNQCNLFLFFPLLGGDGLVFFLYRKPWVNDFSDSDFSI